MGSVSMENGWNMETPGIKLDGHKDKLKLCEHIDEVQKHGDQWFPYHQKMGKSRHLKSTFYPMIR